MGPFDEPGDMSRHSGRVGLPLRVMAFNIWHGGRLDGSHDALSTENVAQLLEFLRLADPDLLFCVETYGTGRLIERALNTARSDERVVRGIQLTPEQPKHELGTGERGTHTSRARAGHGRNGAMRDSLKRGRDNLWLYTWLPVAGVYSAPLAGVLTSFNVGGVRIVLPDGTDLHAFTIWLHHLDDPVAATTRAVLERERGRPPSMTEDQIVATDRSRRLPMASMFLDRLRAWVPDDSAPVIIGGDFNSLSHLDWSAAYADAPGHGGLVLDWPVMRAFEAAGFTDTYRLANPDAARHPGDTKPNRVGFHVPARIDYILTRGEGIRVVRSYLHTRRLPQHRGGPLDRRYPFYSDHAAVVNELVVSGAGSGTGGGASSRRSAERELTNRGGT